MSIILQILEKKAEHHKRVILGPDAYAQLATEYFGIHINPTTPARVFGLDVVERQPEEFCQNCGAPHEPNVCSYCGTETPTLALE